MLNWMVNMGQLAENPLARVKSEKKRPKRQTEISVTDEAAITADLVPVMKVLFIVAIDSAMRRDEVRTMEWVDVDWKSRTVFLAAGKTKSKRSRTAYLTTRAADALRSLPRFPSCPYVFANPRTLRPYSPTHVSHSFRVAADDNGVRAAPGDGSVRLHDTRRTAIVRLVRLGASLPAVQEILGHADLLTTSSYLHVTREDVASAHALLDRATRRGPMRAPTAGDAGKHGIRKTGAAG